MAPTEVSYLHNDQLGRPQKMTDSAGLITSDRTQRPFGETVTDSGLDSTPIRFPGQYADAETGLSYNYFRDFDPSLGRYIESDPIGLGDGVNTYGYAQANPVRFVDPTGEAVVAPPEILQNLFNELFGGNNGPKVCPVDLNEDPNSDECKALAKKIQNLRSKILQREAAIRANPQKLPERSKGGKLRDSIQGHRKLINKDWNQLRKLEKLYEKKCWRLPLY
ncbi:MAG: RHS repeat-associated core domain-containing protein [Pseudomonadota bacterium]